MDLDRVTYFPDGFFAGQALGRRGGSRQIPQSAESQPRRPGQDRPRVSGHRHDRRRLRPSDLRPDARQSWTGALGP